MTYHHCETCHTKTRCRLDVCACLVCGHVDRERRKTAPRTQHWPHDQRHNPRIRGRDSIQRALFCLSRRKRSQNWAWCVWSRPFCVPSRKSSFAVRCSNAKTPHRRAEKRKTHLSSHLKRKTLGTTKLRVQVVTASTAYELMGCVELMFSVACCLAQ